MYSFEPCGESACGKPAFTGERTCLEHAPRPEEAIAAALARLESRQDHRDQNLAGLKADGIDLSGKRFFGCSFIGADLKNVLFTRSIFRLCFFDGAAFESCDFSHLDAMFCSFGGAWMHNVSFESSELLHASFCGTELRECTFNNSNLYDSRFIRSVLVDTDFEDCDLKRVYLIPAKEERVSYRYSNTMEAVRDLEHLYL